MDENEETVGKKGLKGKEGEAKFVAICNISWVRMRRAPRKKLGSWQLIIE